MARVSLIQELSLWVQILLDLRGKVLLHHVTLARQQQARLRKVVAAAHEDFAGTLQWLLRLSSEARTSLGDALLLNEPPHTFVPVRFRVFGDSAAYFGALDPLLDVVLSRPANRPAILRAVDLVIFVPLVHLLVLDFLWIISLMFCSILLKFVLASGCAQAVLEIGLRWSSESFI